MVFLDARGQVDFESGAVGRDQKLLACTDLVGFDPAPSVAHGVRAINAVQSGKEFVYSLPPSPPANSNGRS